MNLVLNGQTLEFAFLCTTRFKQLSVDFKQSFAWQLSVVLFV